MFNTVKAKKFFAALGNIYFAKMQKRAKVMEVSVAENDFIGSKKDGKSSSVAQKKNAKKTLKKALHKTGELLCVRLLRVLSAPM